MAERNDDQFHEDEFRKDEFHEEHLQQAHNITPNGANESVHDKPSDEPFDMEGGGDERLEQQARQERMRRLAAPRLQRTRQPEISPEISPEIYNVSDFDEDGNHVSAPFQDDVDFGRPRRSNFASQPLYELVPGFEIVNGAGTCYCTVRAFPVEEPRGPLPLGGLLELAPALFHRYHPNFGLSTMGDYRRAAFIDTETTGLGGGAGVYCFMIGVGNFEAYNPYAADQLPAEADPAQPATHFVVRQFFMRNPAEEAPLLLAVADLLARHEMTVTFNGRSFDLPMLRLRYAQNRRFFPAKQEMTLLNPDGAHLDLLMPARKVWRRRLQSCRLLNLEQMILGLHRSEEDVPGHLIPMIYEQFVRTGHAEAIRRVFYHNHEDIMTMVSLADHLSRAFGATTEATHAAVVTGMDWAGLGRAYERAGELTQAEVAFRRALESVRTSVERGEILAALGELYKRQGLWNQATETWQDWITSVPGSDPTPYVELAKYCEWECQDLEQAEMWTAWALHNLERSHPSSRRPGDVRELQHRLARLQRKRAASGAN